MSALKTYPRAVGILSLDNKSEFCMDHLTDSQSSLTLSPCHEVAIKERGSPNDDRTKAIDYSGGSPSSIATSGFSSGKSASSVRSVTREMRNESSSSHTANTSHSPKDHHHRRGAAVASDMAYTSSTVKYAEGQSVPYQCPVNKAAVAGNRMYKSNSENNGISLARSSSGVTSARPSTSSWNDSINSGSAEQETDYITDPAQGNAYYKGQFLGKVVI